MGGGVIRQVKTRYQAHAALARRLAPRRGLQHLHLALGRAGAGFVHTVLRHLQAQVFSPGLLHSPRRQHQRDFDRSPRRGPRWQGRHANPLVAPSLAAVLPGSSDQAHADHHKDAHEALDPPGPFAVRPEQGGHGESDATPEHREEPQHPLPLGQGMRWLQVWYIALGAPQDAQKQPCSSHPDAGEHQGKRQPKNLQPPADAAVQQSLGRGLGVDPGGDGFAPLLRLAQGAVPLRLPVAHVVGTGVRVQPHALRFVRLARHGVAVPGQHLVGGAPLAARVLLQLRIQHLGRYRLP